MKKTKKLLAALFCVVMLVSCMTTSAFAAETGTQDGLNAVIQTDKESYAANEDIQITVTVTNTNTFEVKNVSIESLLPNALTLKDGDLKSKTVDLQPGETLSISCVAVLEKAPPSFIDPTTTEPITEAPDTTDEPTTAEPTTIPATTIPPTETPATTEQTETTTDSGSILPVEPSTVEPTTGIIEGELTAVDNTPDNPNTGSGSTIVKVLLIALAAAAVVAAIILITRKSSKKATKVISLVLCGAIAVSSFATVGFIKVGAESVDDEFTIEKEIQIDNDNYILKGKISYAISPDDSVFNDKEQEIIKILELSNGQLPEITVDEEDNIPSFIDGKFSDVLVHDSSDAIKALDDIKNIMNFENPEEEFVENKVQKNANICYYRLGQVYNGVPVYGKELVVSASESGEIISLSGDYDPHLSLSVEPIISEETAKENAKEYNGYSGTVKSNGLVIYNIGCETPELVWEIFVGMNHYFISATSGEVVDYYGVMTNSAIGVDVKGENREFNVTKESDNNFSLVDGLRNIRVYDAGNGELDIINGSSSATPISSTDNTWNNPAGVTAISNISKVYDYYLNILGRDSTNNNHATIHVWVNYGGAYANNAFSTDNDYNDDESFLAFGSEKNYVLPLDTAAHEFTHSVTGNINGLIYEGESGALNESYSDILGAMIENSSGDDLWLHRQDHDDGPNRSLKEPKKYGQPDKVGGFGYNKNADPHTNSGIVNHAAYLMYSKGINSTQELATLFYRSMFYLTPTSTFKDARAAVLRAGKDMGLNSTKMSAIVEAFNEVNIVRTEEQHLVTGQLSGKVIDAETHNAIPGAEIIAVENFDFWNWYTFGAGITYSNSDGNFSLSLSAGKYKIVVAAPGYKSVTLNDVRVDAFGHNYLENSVLLEELQTPPDQQVFYAGGEIKSATTGNPLSDVTIKFRKNHGTQSGPYVQNENGTDLTLQTSSDGRYYTSALDYGYYTLEASKEGYVTGYKNILVSNSDTISMGQDVVLSPIGSIGSSQYRVVLTWDENPRDLDSHVEGKLENGSSFHVYYGHKSQYDGEIEVCNLDVDDTTSYGPETITLNTTPDAPYYYYIKRYAGSGTVGTSGAQINVYQGENLVATFNVPTDQGDGDYWNVFAIVNGELIAKNTITSSADTSYANS